MVRKFTVAIDTSIYRMHPKLNDLGFDAIARMSAAGALSVFIPYVVKHEFLSDALISISKEVASAEGSLNRLRSKIENANVVGGLNSIISNLEDLNTGMLSDRETIFDEWVKAVNAIEQDPSELHASDAFRNYFLGVGPVAQAKARKDIPDSFIYESVKHLEPSIEMPLIFVCKDNALRNAVGQLPNITTFEDLDSMMKSPQLRGLIDVLEAETNPKSFIAAIGQVEDENCFFADEIQRAGMSLLCQRNIVDSSLPSDDRSASIESYGIPESLVFRWSEATYYGDGTFGIGFQFMVSVELSMFVFKADYYALEEYDSASVQDWNDHYYDMTTEKELWVHGVISAAFDIKNLKSLSTDEVAEAISYGIDSIEVTEVC